MGIVTQQTKPVTFIFRLHADLETLTQFFDQCEQDFDPVMMFPVGRGMYTYVAVTTYKRTIPSIKPVASFQGQDELRAIDLVDADYHFTEYGW